MARRLISASFLMLTLFAATSCSDQSGKQGADAGAGAARPPAPVSVITLQKMQQPLTTVLAGRATAFQTADIRPRVGGVIKAIPVKEGSFVKAGDLLYKIEDDTYRATLAQAQATLEKAQAAIPADEANLARYEKLANSGASQKDYEAARTTLMQDRATVAGATADVKTATINLNLTEIRAPFDGVVSATNFSVGNVVTASQTDSLMTLRQINPIYIGLNESSVNLLRLKAAIDAGHVAGKDQGETTEIRLTLEDGTEYSHVGKLDMSEMAVSTTTGTVSIRTLFENPENLILPGTFVRATVTVGKETGYAIPQRAASRDANGDLTAKFVTAENKVETRTFRDSKLSGHNWLVSDGVKDGDRLIVDGFQWIGDQAPVTPVPAEIDAMGFVIAKAAPDAPAPVKP